MDRAARDLLSRHTSNCACFAQRERDKPRQGVVANTPKSHRNGAVGFIDWLDGCGLPCKLNANPTQGATRQRQLGEATQHTVLTSQSPEYSHRLNRPP
jgi:hypothetical protein